MPPAKQPYPAPSATYLDEVEEGARADFQLVDVLTVVAANRLLIASLALIGVMTAFVASKLTTKTYQSTATSEINKISDTPLGVNTLSGVPQQFGSSEEMAAIMLTEQEELQSASVAFSVIDQLGLASQYPFSEAAKGSPNSQNQAGESASLKAAHERERLLQFFQARLKVELVKDTKLLKVSFVDTDPERAARVANAVIETYIQQYTKARSAAAQKSSSWLTDHLASLRAQVLESERQVNEYQKRTGIVGTPEQLGQDGRAVLNSDSATVERFLDLNKDLTNAQAALIAKRSVFHITLQPNTDYIFAANTSNLGDTAGAPTAITEGPELSHLSALRRDREQLALQVVSREDTFGAKSPQMLQLHAEIAVIDNQINQQVQRIRDRARSEFMLAVQNEEGLRSLVDKQQAEVTNLTVRNNQLALLQQEANSKRALYQDLLTKLEQTNVSANISQSNITIVDPARPSSTPVTPKTMRNLLTGLVTGLLFGLFLSFGIVYRRNAYTLLRGERRPHVITQSLLLFSIGLGLLSIQAVAQGSPAVQANIEQTPATAYRASPPVATSLQLVPEDFSNVPLQPGYLVELSVYGVPEMAASLRVDADGNIIVPLLGTIKVSGKTIAQAQAEVANRFVINEILKNPQVTLNVSQYTAGNISVLGEVQSPGRIQVLGPKTLEQVIALAGGETTAAGNTLEIERQGQPSFLIRYSQGNSPDQLRKFIVQSGDSVYVRRAGVIYVLGAVNRPGGYLMVNRGGLTVLEAVSLASGMTILAKQDNVYIVRTLEDGAYRQIPVNYEKMSHGKAPPVPLQVNDILYVSTSAVKSVLINGAGLIGTAATAAIYRTP